MILRKWTKEDNEKVLEIERQSFKDPWTKQMFDALFVVSAYEGAVVVLEDEIVGYISTAYNFFEVEILNIAVNEKYRRQKIGEALIDWAIDLAKTKKAESVFLEVRESNVPAKSLYKKMGFLEVGLRRGYYADGENAVLMSLVIGDNV